MSALYEKKSFPEAYIAPTAVVRGDVVLGRDCSVWYGAVLRGDCGRITLGEGTNVQDNCVLHDETTVGRYCVIGHGAVVHGCTIGDECLIGMGSVILSGARIGDHCLVGAGALVTGKTDAPPYSMLLGSPARVVKTLSEEAAAGIRVSAEHYIGLARQMAKEENEE